MDKIVKTLKKLRKKEYEAFLLLMQHLKKDYTKVPGIERLSGMKNWYKVRIGRYRLIFEVKKGKVEIKKITKRDERTYKNL